MQPPLFDVNLQHLPDDELAGHWVVTARSPHPLAVAPVFEAATALQLQPPAELHVRAAAHPDDHVQGRWEVHRDALLKRPYLHFELPTAPAAVRALITRLRRSPDGAVRHLTLYFQSGLELQLVAEMPAPDAPSPALT